MTHNFKVGQKLWFVGCNRYSQPHEVEIESVGRKWATLKHNAGRMNLKNMWLDGGRYSSPGRCYFSKGEFETEKTANEAWRDLINSLTYATRPKGVTIETIQKVKELLGYD